MNRTLNPTILLTLVFLTSLGRATTIVAIWTPDRIIMAADSMGVLSDQYGNLVANKPVSKIGSEGNIRYGVAGLYSYTLTGFNVQDIAHATVKTWHVRDGDLYSFDQAFNTELSIALAKARRTVNVFIRNNPNYNYADTISAGLDSKGKLRVIHHINDISNSELQGTDKAFGFAFISTLEDVPEGTSIQPRVVIAGERAEIIAYQHQHPDWAKMNLIEAARTFVQLEIEAHPHTVGPSIVIIEIDKDGTVSEVKADTPDSDKNHVEREWDYHR